MNAIFCNDEKLKIVQRINCYHHIERSAPQHVGKRTETNKEKVTIAGETSSNEKKAKESKIYCA